MIVDDEPHICEAVKITLEAEGFKVLTALSGPECLEKLKSESVDMILIDFFMPGMNGIEVLKKIRQNYGSLPVIIMTAYWEKDLVIEALRNGCNSFIEKPFTLTQLMQEIERVRNLTDTAITKA